MNWVDRAAIFLKAADMISGDLRPLFNAAAMLNLGKNVYQAEIDSVCEMIDFFRFNVRFMCDLYSDQPSSSPGVWNYCEYRPLEGFVLAVTPFNFASIAGNLPTSPALMGNTVIWKPASSAVYIAYYIMKTLEKAGLPPGVINFVPGQGRLVGDRLLHDPELAGIHFTGGTATFQDMWRTVGESIQHYRSYPRIVGETGGKGFIFMHASADFETAVTAIIRGAFGYQGQKCSAASRVYVPDSIWPKFREILIEQGRQVSVGDITDFTQCMSAVIDRGAYDSIMSYVRLAQTSPEYEILVGGGGDDSRGYFIEPTVVQTTDPMARLMKEEIFGPVVTVYVYPEQKYRDTLELCDRTAPYALTGAVFASDREAIRTAVDVLRFAAGNFYINDKPTGAVVGQQPFGGGRASGTNDKAGSRANLMRWVSIRTIKEAFVAPKSFRYNFMMEP